MTLVRPGRETGDYHLIVSGIPFNRSWQDFNDIVRRTPGEPLSYVWSHVHEGMGCGWVLLKNEDEFWRVYDYLTTVQWDGRMLMVDARNVDSQTSLGVPNSASQTGRASSVSIFTL